ncbi:hypothetical protein EJB05_23943, partial [Eragrostis curvula]
MPVPLDRTCRRLQPFSPPPPPLRPSQAKAELEGHLSGGVVWCLVGVEALNLWLQDGQEDVPSDQLHARPPPSLAMPDPASTARCADFPDWVILYTRASVSHHNANATTARSVTSSGHPISVTFELVDPPGLSRCVVDCPDLTPGGTRSPPCVTGADGAFLLIRVMFPKCRSPTNVFLYGAGPGAAPSLRLLPRPYPSDLHFQYVGVLSCGHQHEHCLVVVPVRRFEARGHMSYDLKIFSTVTGSWSTKVAGVAPYLSRFHGLVMHRQTKVLNVGGGSLAWVDLRRGSGMLLCNVLDDRPEMNLIRLPALMPANEELLGDCSEGCVRPIRDVTCTNGYIRFIEMEDVDDDDDSDTATMQCRWRATVFKTTTNSWNWERCCTVHSDGLSPADSCLPELFPEIWNKEEKTLTLEKVISNFPILDMFHDDVVYMTSQLDVQDPNGWVLAVDTRNNKLDRAVPFSTAKAYCDDTKLQCAFSKYLSKSLEWF